LSLRNIRSTHQSWNHEDLRTFPQLAKEVMVLIYGAVDNGMNILRVVCPTDGSDLGNERSLAFDGCHQVDRELWRNFDVSASKSRYRKPRFESKSVNQECQPLDRKSPK
jgi:hypothetical protein